MNEDSRTDTCPQTHICLKYQNYKIQMIKQLCFLWVFFKENVEILSEIGNYYWLRLYKIPKPDYRQSVNWKRGQKKYLECSRETKDRKYGREANYTDK